MPLTANLTYSKFTLRSGFVKSAERDATVGYACLDSRMSIIRVANAGVPRGCSDLIGVEGEIRP